MRKFRPASIIGTDDATPNAGAMLYFDVHNVSREYRWTIAGNVLTWWRDDPSFSQRMVHTVAEDGQGIDAQGEMSRNGQPGEPDLHLTYTRVSRGACVRRRAILRDGFGVRHSHQERGRKRGECHESLWPRSY